MLKKLLLVSITAFTLTACGGGGDSDSSGPVKYAKPATPTVNGGECQTADNGNVI